MNLKLEQLPTNSNIPAKYDHLKSEARWYDFWHKTGVFRSQPDERKAYTIVMPPPNVTGILHMGHMLNNTIQDVLIRRARLRGYNACWVPGTDHASIATEAKVVNKLREEGINKFDLSREEFLEHAWEWTRKHGGIIQQQLKKLGCSCDWEREAFTMDEARSESVLQVFVKLHEQGLIYRGYRMVNWDPKAKTTLSDEEVIHKEVNGKLYYVKYPAKDKPEEFLTIATTRPETILGDVALCVNPNDERYQDWIGRKVNVPIAGRAIPVIADDYVDPEFGTGCLKITPAHDQNDYAIGQRHKLEILDIFNADGSLNEHGLHYAGQDRFKVRKALAAELEDLGLMVKVEDYQNSVGTSERTGAVIEPRLSDQWFLKMKELAEPALRAVLDDDAEVDIVPAKFKNTYRHWMENVIDWNISRQLWWGHQIPAWYFGEGKEDYVVALNAEEALEKARQKSGRDLQTTDLRQDQDVLDTWFSSWIWPISVFDGIRNPENEEFKYYYPTRDLVTAPEILFFWVARMIMLGYWARDEKPFSQVYLTGIVRDKLGRKMSKQLGNSPDPIKLMDKYSTDGVRVGMLLTSPAGNDLPFDEELCLQGRNFTNKIWNAARLIKGWELTEDPASPEASVGLQWFENKLSAVLEDLEKSFEQYRVSEALMTTYKFIWDDFCNWLLEIVKPAYQQPIARQTYEQVVGYFEKCLILAHPFIPFITEEIWQLLSPREEGATICLQNWPAARIPDHQFLSAFQQMLEVVNGVRNIRATKGISPREALDLELSSEEALSLTLFPVAQKLANIGQIRKREMEDQPGLKFMAGTYEFFVPLQEAFDLEEEKERLSKEIDYQQGFLKSVEKKLSNERFVSNAPAAVVDKEKQKKADAEAKLATLEKSLKALKAET